LLVDSQSKRLINMILNIIEDDAGGTQEDAEDILFAGLYRVWKEIGDKFDASRSPLRTWINVLVASEAKEWRKKRVRRLSIERRFGHIIPTRLSPQQPATRDPARVVESINLPLEDIDKALTKVPDRDREIFKLFHVFFLSIREIAAKESMSPSGVKSSLRRTRRFLKGSLPDLEF